MGENHLTSCAKNHSCTNTYSNVIVSFRNPESKAAGPRLATPTATCFTTREARRRRQRNQEPKSKQRNAPHLYQTPPPIKVAANLQGGGQGSASAAHLAGCPRKSPPKKCCATCVTVAAIIRYLGISRNCCSALALSTRGALFDWQRQKHGS